MVRYHCITYIFGASIRSMCTTGIDDSERSLGRVRQHVVSLTPLGVVLSYCICREMPVVGEGIFQVC